LAGSARGRRRRPPAECPCGRESSLGIPTAAQPLDAFEHPVDLLFEVTGHSAVSTELLEQKPPGLEVIGSSSLQFFWNPLQDGAKATPRMMAQLDMAAAVGSICDPRRQIARAIQNLAQACGVDRCAFLSVDGASGGVTPVAAEFASSANDRDQWEAFEALRGLTADDLPFLRDVFDRRAPIEIEDATAHGVVTAHCGRLWLDDAVSAGAAFVVELPVAGGEAGPERSPSPPIPSGRRILVVDDEPPVANVLADLLSALGSTVTVANSARQAREHLDRERYDLVTLDLVMPGESGADFFRALRARDPQTAEKVVVVTEPVSRGSSASTSRRGG
jgi:CheY-like chemotaxis protein